jgi:indolepyruvate ferredoxin oxidoreductase
VFRVLKTGKKVRGTPLDLFGLPEVRRVERALIGEYRDLVHGAVEKLHPANHDVVVEIAGLADMIRGYEHVKLRNVAKYRERAAELQAAL